MSSWIGTITNLLQNPFFLILAVILAIVIVIGIIKKLFKLSLIVLTALVIYIGYSLWTGQDVKTSLDGIKNSVSETATSNRQNAKDTKKAVQEKVEETLWGKFIDFLTGDDD